MASMRYRAAIRDVLHKEMARDSSVVMLGQDIGRLGGSFAVSKGLLDAYGPARIIETPISESAIVGTAVGMAMLGLKPIAELMFADFIALAMDQIVNTAAKAIFASAGVNPLPLVIRAPYGATGSGMHHDQSPESWIANVPGLKIVAPATAADAAGLLRAAIRDPNPVVYFEHRGLYNASGEVPDDDDHVVPLGKASIARQGRDVSVIAHGAMTALALKIAADFEREGIAVEVVDLRSIKPLDMETILDSVHRTRRAVIVHESPLMYGIGGEIAARINEDLFGRLLAPVRRLGAAETPVPLEAGHRTWYLPGADALGVTIHALVEFNKENVG